jgi:hypothetical protein
MNAGKIVSSDERSSIDGATFAERYAQMVSNDA